MVEAEVKDTQVVEKVTDVAADKSAASETSSNSPENTTQPDGAAKPADSPDYSALEKKYKDQSFKQAADWKRKYEDLEGRFSKLESTYTEKLESIVGMMSPKQESNLSDQDKMALVNLFKMGMQVPEIASMLGLDKTKTLEQTLNQERTSRMEREFESEFNSVVSSYSEKYGLPKDELEKELQEYIDSNEFYGSKQYAKGLVSEAAKSLYFDRLDELKTRQANLALIKEQNEKKKSGTESPSKGKPPSKPAVEKDMGDFIKRRIQEEGGLSFD